MGIVRFALRFPYTFYVLAVLVLFLGSTSIVSMPTDIFPEINIPVVTIVWQYTGLSTPEMEQRVTTYSQFALSSSVNGIQDIEAQTLNGISVQKVFFQPDERHRRLVPEGIEIEVKRELVKDIYEAMLEAIHSRPIIGSFCVSGPWAA